MSVGSIKHMMKEQLLLEPKANLIRDLIRERLGMRYHSIKAVSVHANSDKNLVLRQQFALKFINLLIQNKIILNVDETWRGMCDFRRRKWRVPGTTNSIPQL